MDLLRKRDFVSSPYRSEREKLISIQRWNVRKFFKLIDSLQDFLDNDKCYRLADNYLIAMVFTYFLRATLEADEYTQQNFFAALLLAYNMEEDEGEFMLMELVRWLDCSVADLKQVRNDLFQRIEYRGAVSRACCDVVMRSANPTHKAWQRRRHAYHSGIVNNKMCCDGLQESVCPICNGEESDDEDVDY